MRLTSILAHGQYLCMGIMKNPSTQPDAMAEVHG